MSQRIAVLFVTAVASLMRLLALTSSLWTRFQRGGPTIQEVEALGWSRWWTGVKIFPAEEARELRGATLHCYEKGEKELMNVIKTLIRVLT